MRAIALGFALVLAACGSRPAKPPVVAVDDKPPPRPTTVSLERAEAMETLVVVRMLLEEPVVVDAMALASLKCMTVTMKEQSPLLPRDAAAKLFDALRSQGLRIGLAKGMWVVEIDEQHPPKSCAPEGRATAAGEVEPLQEVLRSIREISPTEHAITQHGIDVFFEHQPDLMRQVRIVPEQEGGKIAGIRMFGVRQDGIMGRLGFENGDRIERILGQSVSTPEKALEIYAAMRKVQVIDIEINRRGVTKKLIVRIE